MKEQAANMNCLWAGLIVEELLRCGVDTFVLSPGSRCAPLTLAVAEEPRATPVVHFDERGAAYYALGYAQASGRPVALICTSGTAAANYLPAAVEAANAQTPLILLTADRPPELLDTGANQTIDQTHLYGTRARGYFALPCPDASMPPEAVLTTIGQAVYLSRYGPAGPVHVNCAFREPLVPAGADEDFSGYLRSVAAWRAHSKPYTAYARAGLVLNAEDLRFLADLARGAQRGALVVGQLADRLDQDAVLRLGETLGWPIFADVTSGLRLGGPQSLVVHCYDLLLLSTSFCATFCPDLVLHFGGPVTSKRLNQQLEKTPPEHYVRIAAHPQRHDPIHRVTLRVQADLAPFCGGLAAACRASGNTQWLDLLQHENTVAESAIAAFLSPETALTEPGVARCLSEHMTEDEVVFLGNSMPIRDMDMFGAGTGSRVLVFANRGASGIDGNIATTAGIARATGRSVTAVLGDLAVLHDLNSLSLLRDPDSRVVLIVINNDGGGIFHFLPIAEHPAHFEKYFGTPHGLGFEHAASQFGLSYSRPENIEAFLAAYEAARELGASSIIEVRTNREENLRVHRALQQAVIEAVGGAREP